MSDDRTTAPDTFIEQACEALANMKFSDRCRLARYMLREFKPDGMCDPKKWDNEVELAVAIGAGASELLQKV